MSWLERNASFFHGDPLEEINRFVRAAGVDRSLNEFSGVFGVRRFIIHFSRTNGVTKVTEIESVRLSHGGGPPPPDPERQAVKVVEQCLERLYMNMAVGPVWQEGAIGFVRDVDNNCSIAPFFDEDKHLLLLNKLPLPDEGHPLEDPEYRKVVAMMESQIDTVWARTSAMSPEWDVWDIQNGKLRLIFGSPDFPTEVWRREVKVLGTFDLGRQIWAWEVDSPLFSENVYRWEYFFSSWEGAMELSVLTTARLNANWLFVSEVEGGEVALFAAVWGD